MVADGFPKSLGAIPAKKTTSSQIAEIVLDERIVLYAIPEWFPNAQDSKVSEKPPNAVSVSRGTQLLTATAFQFPLNGRTERFKETIVDMLCHYVSKQ